VLVESEELCYLSDPGGNVKLKAARQSMSFQRNLAISAALGIAGGMAAYLLAWGLFTTHQELGMDSRGALTMALWAGPLVFVGSLIYFALRNSGARR